MAVCLHDLDFELCGDCSATSVVVTPQPVGPKRQPGLAPLTTEQRRRVRAHAESRLREGGSALSTEVLRRIDERLAAVVFDREETAYRPHREFFTGGDASAVTVDAEEYLLMHALARTSGALQFSVTRGGEVYASSGWGFTKEESERLYVTSLSPLLSQIAGFIQAVRVGKGGRFYVQGYNVLDARTNRILMTIHVPDSERLPAPVRVHEVRISRMEIPR